MILLFAGFALPVWSDPFQQINFADAVHLAMNANPRIKASQATIEAANASIIETRGEGLLKLNLKINAARSDNPLNVFGYKLSQGNASFKDFGFAQFTGLNSINTTPTALDNPGYYNNFNTGIVINMPLYTGGKNSAELRRDESLLLAAQHGDQQAKSELSYDVLQAYEGVHTATQLMMIAKKEIKAANSFVRLTRSLSQQAIVIQSDVLLAETYRRSADTTFKAALAERNNQLDAFRILIGKPDSHFVPGVSVDLYSTKQSSEVLEQGALLSNSQLLSLKSRINAYRAGIHSADAAQWPQVNLQLRHDWNANTPALSGTSNTAMLEVNWELFSSGAHYGASKHAVAEYKKSLADYESVSNNIRLSLIQALRAMQTAEIQLKSSNLSTRQLVKVVRLLTKRYGLGVANLSQLLDSQSRLDSARIQQVMARYNLILAQARLLMLMNKLNPDISSSKHNWSCKA